MREPPPPVREYIVRIHDPVDADVEKRGTEARISFAHSSNPPVVPRVGEEVAIGLEPYSEAQTAQHQTNRVRVMTRIAHYFELGQDGYVDYIDVYTEWRPLN